MHLRAKLLHNGATVVGSENVSWEQLTDGYLDIPLQPGIWRQLAENDCTTYQDVRLRIDVHGLRTVEEVTRELEQQENRLRAIERERFRMMQMEYAKDMGLIIPERWRIEVTP